EGLEPGPPRSFQLQPGDVLTLRTIFPSPLDVPRLMVDEAGLLHAPLMGAVPVAGVSLAEAEARLQEKLRRFDRFGIVALTLVEPAGHRASVLGAVAKPGAYVLGGTLRVAELLAMAGGARVMDGDAEVVELADLDAARLVRGGGAVPISVSRALAGEARHNVPVEPGDVLFVPALQGASVRVLGEVKTARVVPWRGGLRLSEALARSGGMSGSADETDVRVIRGPLSRPRIYRANVAALVDGRATDVELARGDIVFVTRHWFASATDVVQRLVPLLAIGTVAATVQGVSAVPR
ncbi:MAG TPA: SLBB domain-containing protein, partial [Longimicrobium sp.]|nr:SLBB domain-containing protein [Longimicrobium sp.]